MQCLDGIGKKLLGAGSHPSRFPDYLTFFALVFVTGQPVHSPL
jgi:hypothetical protein